MSGKKMSLKKKLAIVAAGLALFGVMTVGGMELSCSSWFCISCHEMKELGNNWEFSKHGPYNANNPKMYNCLKCHAQPGVTGLLKAKVSGLFSVVYHLGRNYHLEATQPVVCIREGCHQLEDLDRADRPDQVVSFNHAKHIKVMEKIGARSQCMPCHRKIAHGENTYLPDMKKDCLATCHANERITASKCNSCHANHPDIQLKGKDVSLFELHKDADVSCTDCHIGLCKATARTCDGCHEGDNYGSLIISYEEKTKPHQKKPVNK